LVTEIFLFLGQNKSKKDWRAVAVFPQRSLDLEIPIEYQRLLTTQQIQRVYLNELDSFYKFPNLSRQEIETMFGLSDFKQTRV
jgi:predicted transposase YdaD